MENREWKIKITISFLLCLMLTIVSCSKFTEPKQEELAKEAAKAYYDQLLHGDYNSFVEGSLKGDTIPTDYKEELLTNAKMFIEQQQEAHQGIDKIEATRALCDSTKAGIVTAEAFLTVYYKDGTNEEISVPMVRKNNIWYLR